MRTGLCISSSTYAIDCKLCQIRWCIKIYTSKMSSLWSRALGIIYKPDKKMRTRFCFANSTCNISCKRCLIGLGNKRITSMMSSWWSRDLGTMYRPVTKWEPDFVSQVLHELSTSNFVRYVRVTKELQQCHHGDHMTWVQFKDQIKNEDQILYIKFYL